MDYSKLLTRFSICDVDDDNIHHCYRIRHIAYCEERDFLPKSDKCLEFDQDDKRSKHILVKDRETGRYVGTARLILNVGDPLPIFTHAEVTGSDFIMSLVPKHEIAEISRFASIEHYEPKLMSLVISLGVLMLAEENSIEVLASAMSPVLNRSLSAHGLDMYPVGPLCEYHGKRRAYLKKTEDIIAKSKNKCPNVWRHFDLD